MSDLSDPSLYLNRELSWLDFNARVLATAERADVPLLERLRFVAIASSNLDEFYMVRVANIIARIHGRLGPPEESADGRGPRDLFEAIGQKTTETSRRIAEILFAQLLPQLAAEGVEVLTNPLSSRPELEAPIHDHYLREVHPVLTPIAVDPTHPFPHLRNRSLNIALRLEAAPNRSRLDEAEGPLLAIVQVPAVLSRFLRVSLPDGRATFVGLEVVIAMRASELFPGHRVVEACPFRVTRAAELDYEEDEAENLLTTIQQMLRRRDRGAAVRLELQASGSAEITSTLCALLNVEERHVHRAPLLAANDLAKIYEALDRPDLKDRPFVPATVQRLRFQRDPFRAIAERDVLIHHPYESYQHIVDFADAAADDPSVVAIKQTLYRTGGSSPIVRALARAVQNGKQVTALVELKARFDEAANIKWAQELEKAGVHVVYGLIGFKTHAKLLLVIRREGDGLKRYLHIATGNYNPSTARAYTDFSLLTANEDLTRDAMLLFNVLTGYGDLPPMSHLVVAPFDMRARVLGFIEREIGHAQAGREAKIIAKMNALVDPAMIKALYRASQAGVRVDLIIRGICCLRPGIPGLSENIHVRSIIGRFLEHARVYYWHNGGKSELRMSSADWMPRNLDRRVEVGFPILSAELFDRVLQEILATELADDMGSWSLGSDGRWTPSLPSLESPVSAQQVFMGLAKTRGALSVRTDRSTVAIGNPLLRVAAEAQARRLESKKSQPPERRDR
ncbi:MAG: polyphosphate kinase 1 [Deltaproteobacteria bacterium]|nr:polyphosphate kinase 1 [Deltaproteobacteria bacterium]